MEDGVRRPPSTCKWLFLLLEDGVFLIRGLTFEYTNPEVLILQGFGEDIYVLLNF